MNPTDSTPQRQPTREEQLARRRAYQHGAESLYIRTEIPSTPSITAAFRVVYGRAKELYPLPPIDRPRIVRDSNGCWWKYVDGQLKFTYEGNETRVRSGGAVWGFGITVTGLAAGMNISQERILLLYDLLQNPTETVQDEG